MTVIRTFVSAAGGVGKTTILLNLAVCLARMKQKVLCLDADPGRGLLSAAGIPEESLAGSGAGGLRTTVADLSFGVIGKGRSAVLDFSTSGEPPDWVLIDAGPWLPSPELLAPGSALVVCTDASGAALARLAPFLEALTRLWRETGAPVTLDRILFSRVDVLSRVQSENARQAVRELGADALWETLVRHDYGFETHLAAGGPFIAPPGSSLGRQSARLAIEWMQQQLERSGQEHVLSLV